MREPIEKEIFGDLAETLPVVQERQALLLDLIQSQRTASDPEIMMRKAAETVGRHLQADRVGFFETESDQVIEFTVGWTAGRLPLLSGTLPTLDFGKSYLAEVRRGRTLGIGDVAGNILTKESSFHQMGTKALIGVPIIRSGRWHAGFYVNHGEIRHWTRGEVAFAHAVGEQTWDAVERARAVNALAESETFSRSVMENSPDCIRVLQLNGKLIALNASGRAQMEVEDFETRINRPWTDFWPVEGREQVNQALDAARRGETARFQGHCPTAKGKDRWWDVIVTPLRDTKGQPVRLLSVSRDITEQRRADELFSERARLDALRADVSTSLTRVSTLGQALQSCTEAVVNHLNAAFARIWTLSADSSVLELQASSGLYTHLDGAHARVPVGSFKIGKIAEERTPHLTNDVIHDPRVSDAAWAEREGMVAFAGYPLLVEDRLVGVLALFARHALQPNILNALASIADTISIGIARQKSADALALKSEELARSNTDLRYFNFAAAHDLQEPLRMVTIYTQLLSRHLADKLDLEARGFVDQVVGGARRMSILLDDLLAYTSTTGEQEHPRELVALDRVLAKALANLEPVIESSGAQIVADRLPAVLGYEVQLLQLFQNLVANAIKYRSTKRPDIQITVKREDDHWVIAVRDNGLGVAPEHHQRVFKMFKRLHGKEIPGTGIGLAICERVVELQGGRIWVESEGVGSGSVFSFTLPVQKGASAETVVNVQENATHGNEGKI